MASAEESLTHPLQIISESLSLDPSDLQDHETWTFLGLRGLLASATTSDLQSRSEISKTIPDDVFEKYPTVRSFKAFLLDSDAALPESDDPWDGIPRPKVPLSTLLQGGKPDRSKKTVFLFPDGSGAGGSYLSLPPVGEDVCLIGLNSPFLRQAQNFTFSIERMARLWLDEVLRLQPKGQPFILGGWSAGGFYCYEVAKLLIAKGERVERLILIDSPCRLLYEALPAQVVEELTRKGLMGASGEKKAPEWLVQHFTSTVLSVDKYWPTPFTPETVPKKVHLIWVNEGLVKSVPESGLQVDMNVRVTRFLLESRKNLKSEGWEKLLPGAEYTYDYMTGNHFQITQAPHVSRWVPHGGNVLTQVTVAQLGEAVGPGVGLMSQLGCSMWTAQKQLRPEGANPLNRFRGGRHRRKEDRTGPCVMKDWMTGYMSATDSRQNRSRRTMAMSSSLPCTSVSEQHCELHQIRATEQLHV